MKKTRRSGKTVKRKVFHCNNCGRIQDIGNSECESCGADLGLYGQVRFVEVETESSQWERRKTRREQYWEEQEQRRNRQEQRRAQQKQRQEQHREEEEERRNQQEQRREQRRIQEEQRRDQRQSRKEPRQGQTRQRREKRRRGRLVPGLIAAAVLCLCVLVISPLFKGPEVNWPGEGITWSFDEGTGVLTIRGRGEMDAYAPADGVNVPGFQTTERAAPPWSQHMQDITGVVVEDGVKSVGSCAFAGFPRLKTVTLGNGLETIGAYAFWGDQNVQDIFVPESVTQIGPKAFSNIPHLRNLFIYGDPELPMDMADWEEKLVLAAKRDTAAQTYAKNHDLIFVDLARVREDFTIGGPAWKGQTWSLELMRRRLTISGTGPMENFNGTWMKDRHETGLWDDSRRLPYWSEYRRIVESVELEEGITSIGENAFENCTNLRYASLCTTLKSIGTQAFLSTELFSIFIPAGVTRIEGHAFNNCQKLASVTLPKSLEVLERGTFNMCNNLTQLTIPSGRTEVMERDGAEGIFSDANNPDGRPKNLLIKGYAASPAQRYAQEEGFIFSAIGIEDGIEDTGKCGDNVTWRYVSDERTLYLDGVGRTWEFYRRENWTEPGWEDYKAFVEHIVIGGRVTELAPDVFGNWGKMIGGKYNEDYNNNLVNLKTIEWGKVRKIGTALKNTRISTLEIPASVQWVEGTAFADTDYLRVVKVYGDTTFQTSVFYGCRWLADVYFYGNPKFERDQDGDSLFTGEWDPDYKPNVNLHFYVKRGSTAEAYAIEYNIAYSYLD